MRSILSVAVALGIAGILLPLAKPEQRPSDRKAVEQRTRASEAAANTTGGKAEVKRPKPVAISVAPSQKSAEPMPQLMKRKAAGKHKGKATDRTSAAAKSAR